jgi:hypothetical protein
MLAHEIPKMAWQKLAADIMTFKNIDYLVVVDYYSKFPELAKLEHKTAECVITHLKSIFARHGIPQQLVSDNMPFASQRFHDFAREWGVELITSSPRFAQSNGQAENYVKTMKHMLAKCNDEGRDPYIALLEFRTTPITGMTFSPAQLLMSRVIRTKLPCTDKLLQPTVPCTAHDQLVKCKNRQKHYYDKRSRPLSTLHSGNVVRVRDNSKWEPAAVVRPRASPRSYIIRHNGRELRRNRRHLMPTREQPPLVDSDEEICTRSNMHVPNTVTELPEQTAQGNEICATPPADASTSCESKTRPSRTTKPPIKYKDFVMYK